MQFGLYVIGHAEVLCISSVHHSVLVCRRTSLGNTK